MIALPTLLRSALSCQAPWLVLCIAACGSQVDAGDNLERGQPQDLDAEELDEDRVLSPEDLGEPVYRPDGTVVYPTAGGQGDGNGAGGNGNGSGNGGSGTGGGSGAGGGTGGATLTCFGPAPALGPDLQAFCDTLETDLRNRFAVAFGLLCDERRLANLTLKPCSWSGAGLSDKYRRVLAKTSLDDRTTTDFQFLAAYGVTTQSAPADQVALAFREMTDPDYAQHFVTIRNSRVYNVVRNGPESFDYTAELASSAATVSYRGRLESRQITPTLYALFDYAIADPVILKEHRLLRLLFSGEPGTSRIVAVDEKLIGDGGTHAVAYQNVTDVLKQRMERDYENSRRD